jgi:hypothetical protein
LPSKANTKRQQVEAQGNPGELAPAWSGKTKRDNRANQCWRQSYRDPNDHDDSRVEWRSIKANSFQLDTRDGKRQIKAERAKNRHYP